jgi:hypothetical protein
VIHKIQLALKVQEMAGGSTSAAAPAAAHPLAAASVASTAAASAAAFAPPPPIAPPLTTTAADQQMQASLAAALPPDLTPPWTDPTPPFQRPAPPQDPLVLVQLLAESRRTNQLLEQVVALLQGPQHADPLQQTPAPLTGTGAGPRMAAMLQDLQARRAHRQSLSGEAHSVRMRSQPEPKLIDHLQHLYY